MRIILIAVLTFSFAIANVSAQSTVNSGEFNKFEVYAGYSANNFVNGNPDGVTSVNSSSTPTYRGWNVSASYNPRRYFGFKADVAGQYKSFDVAGTPSIFKVNASVYNFAAGIVIKDNSKTKRFKPFIHALAGVAVHRNALDFTNGQAPIQLRGTNTGFSAILGGGLDLRVNRRVSVRLIQADYNPMFLSGARQNNVRLGFGLVIH